MTIRQVTSRRVGGVPAWVSSLASDIVRQPPCAAASSSSGLVLPPGSPIRLGSENGSELNAPVPAVIAPLPPRDIPFPHDVCGPFDPRHRQLLSGRAASVPSG